MSSNNREEQVEIKKPSVVGHRGPMMMGEKGVKLDHPRKDLWKFLFTYLRPNKRKLIFYLILLIMGTIIRSFSPLLVASIIDNGIMAGDYQYILIMTIIFLSLMIFMGIINFLALYGMGKVSQSIVFTIRNDIFSKLQDMSLAYFDRRPSGDILSIATNDVDQLNQLVGGQFVQIIISIAGIALAIVFMYILNPLLATVSLIVFPIFFLMLVIFKKVITGVFKETRKSISKVTSSIQENIAGAKVVQAYGQEEKKSSEFDEANKENYDAMLKVRQIMSTFMPLVKYVTTMITVCIILFGGFIILGNGSILGISVTIGVLIAFITILAQFFRPFMILMQIQQIKESALSATDRIQSLLEESVEIQDSDNPKYLTDVKGQLQFDEVSFGYILNDKNGEVDAHIEETKPPANMMEKMMEANPMMKRAIGLIKTFPEPYSSFLLKNLMRIPQNIRMQLMMGLMGIDPSEAPKKIDSILAEFQYVVPNTEMAKKHPEYKTTFEGDVQTPPGMHPEMPPKGKQSSSMPMGEIMPSNPNMIQMMVKNLEKMLSKSSRVQQSGGQGMGGGMMGGGGGMPQMSPQGIAHMLIDMKIPHEQFKSFPKVVKDYITEQKKLISRQQSRGYVLEKFNLNIKAGTTLAIVGETGAGKTTMIRLIARFYDVNNGDITIDGIDIRDVRKNDLRELIGLVPQDAFIFTGTIKENLLYAYENVTPEIEEKMIEISKFLGLHNFIETLHKQYDTKLKENGSNISIGQRQLIAFARALLTDPKILILDEASSHVDPYSESLIQDALDKAREGRTTIIIAHRLSTIKNADHIIVLGSDEHGILEEGSHESLLALNGKYKHLLEMQHREIDI